MTALVQSSNAAASSKCREGFQLSMRWPCPCLKTCPQTRLLGLRLRCYCAIDVPTLSKAHFIGGVIDLNSLSIRDGGGASFRMILAYKIELVSVIVTVFSTNRALKQYATKLIYLWQHIAYKLDRDLFVRILITQANQNGKLTVPAQFQSLLLGRADELLPLMQESFPELGLRKEECTGLKCIEAALFFSDLPNAATVSNLVTMNPYPRTFTRQNQTTWISPFLKLRWMDCGEVFMNKKQREFC